MGFSCTSFTTIVFCLTSIVVQSLGELIVLRYSSNWYGTTRLLTCYSEDDDSALVWNSNEGADAFWYDNENNFAGDFLPKKSGPKTNTECAIWNSTKCVANWEKTLSWELVNSVKKPTGPVLDYRWEGFEEIVFTETGGESKYLKLGDMEEYSGTVVFSVRAMRDFDVFLCHEKNMTKGRCFWIRIGCFEGKVSEILRCDGGVPESYRNCPDRAGVRHRTKAVDGYEWRTFRFEWKSEDRTIRLFNETEVDAFLELTVTQWHSISHISIQSEKPSRVRFHFYDYHLTQRKDTKLSTELFIPQNQNFCVELLVGLCPNCQLKVSLLDENGKHLAENNTSGDKNSADSEPLSWKPIHLITNLKSPMTKSVRLEIRAILDDDKDNGRWAVDSFRTCGSPSELRKSTVTTYRYKKSDPWPKFTCQKLSYIKGAVVDSLSTSTINDDTSKLLKLVRNSITFDGSTSLGEEWSVCNPTGCACDRGYTGKDCATGCTPGSYGYNCNERCGSCASGYCDRVDGQCASGCRIDVLLPPFCREVEEPIIEDITDTTARIIQEVNPESLKYIRSFQFVITSGEGTDSAVTITSLVESTYTINIQKLYPGTTIRAKTFVSTNFSGEITNATSREITFRTLLERCFGVEPTNSSIIVILHQDLKGCELTGPYYAEIRRISTGTYDNSFVFPNFPLNATELEPHTEYKLTVYQNGGRVIVWTSKVRTLQSDWYSGFSISATTSPIAETSSLAWLAVLPVILAVCMLVAFIWYRNRKTSPKQLREPSYVEPIRASLTTTTTLPTLPPTYQTTQVLKPSIPRRPSYLEIIPPSSTTALTNDSITLDTLKISLHPESTENRSSDHLYTLPNEPDSCSVSIEDFDKYAKNAASSKLLYSQFKRLQIGLTSPCEYGKSPENIPKNRSLNLIAYDDTRVILEKIPGDPYSDYINATYIKGYKKERAYIAAQGPTSNTVNDFWRMVWEQKVRVMCMLTNVTEGTETKCEKYWPDVGARTKHGDFLISNIDEQVFADYTFRTFELNFEREMRKVTHLHYTGWPSLGVPKNHQSLVAYLRKLEQTPTGNGPILVHCSTGDDRTGTVILCDTCLRQAVAEKTMDVMAVASRMRDSRANMVGTVQQYVLAHIIITESSVSWPTQIPCTEVLSSRMNQLRIRLPSDIQRLKDSAWQQQALRASALAGPPISEYLTDGSPEGIYDDVFEEVRNQIHAVSVDGVRANKQNWACWLPPPLTLPDFWEFVAERNIKLIIILQCSDPGNPSCYDIIPDESVVLPTLRIEMNNRTSLDNGEYFTREELLLFNTSQENERSQTVTVLTCRGWGCGMVQKPPDPPALISLWKASERIPRKEGQTLVLCHDSITGCGLYLALSFLLERMTVERECDVIAAVRAVRQSKPEYVQSMEQIEYLYDAAVNYVESFQTHANFR